MTAFFPATFHLFEIARLSPDTHWLGTSCSSSEVRPLPQGSRDLTQERGLRSRADGEFLREPIGPSMWVAGEGVTVAGFTQSPPYVTAEEYNC
jgi:hypothetical protein